MSEHDHKGYSEEKCTRCGWVMGHQALNCQNNDTPHVFPSQQKPEDIVVQAGRNVLEILRERRAHLVAIGKCPHSSYRYESISQIPYCSDCGKDLTDDLKTWID